jgi:uncharacterized protein YjiS (DUF1127 family)
MSLSTATQQQQTATSWFARRWRDWKRRRRTAAELAAFEDSERERLAHDIGVSGADFCILAGKWPDASALLSQRLQQLKLNPARILDAEPQVMRDLQRVCTLCASKRKCKHDFATNPASLAWRDFCPNAHTLSALLAERGGLESQRKNPRALI